MPGAVTVTAPEELSPREAVKRYLDRRQQELSADSIETYWYRLKLWVEWCEDVGIEAVGELDGWVVEQFHAHRSGRDLAPSTLHNELETLRGLFEYLERIEAVPEGLAERVHVPDVPPEARSRETNLPSERALALLRHYRESDTYASRNHALLELAWHTAARVGAIRALDLADFDRGDNAVEFVHRPGTGTPLKNGINGQRMVALSDEVASVLATYVQRHRWDKHDEHGRQPLFTSLQGRPGTNALRTWMYQATQPCVRTACPHGFDPATCEFRSHNHASKCPSSRAPHHVRTGSMTWHRDRGVPKEVLRERANASEEVIDRYYDTATRRERMELRRRPHLDKLRIDE